jgi:hypothetical protein
MYLDEQGHVSWAGVGMYTESAEALEFIQTFGLKCEGASRLVIWAERKANFSQKLGTGQAYFTMNNQKQDRDESQKAADLKESETWREVARLIGEGKA